MLRLLAALSLLLQLSSSSICSARTLKSNEGVSVVSATGHSCSSVCSAPLLFATSVGGNQQPSYACSVTLDTGATAVGYQIGDGSATCTAVSNGQAVTSPSYSCACLNPGAIQGVQQPVNGMCAGSCAPMQGLTGTPAQAGQDYICMPLSEMGTTNHFGFNSGNSCLFVQGNAVQSTPQYSCVCSYSGAGQAGITAIANTTTSAKPSPIASSSGVQTAG